MFWAKKVAYANVLGVRGSKVCSKNWAGGKGPLRSDYTSIQVVRRIPILFKEQ